MPAKTSKTKSTTQAKKSRVASNSPLKSKRAFNWKIAAVIAVVLVAALGYLFIRLSKASVSLGFIPVTAMSENKGATKGEKSGQPIISGPGFAEKYLFPGTTTYPSTASKLRYSVAFNDLEGDGNVFNNGGGSISVIACNNQIVSTGATNGASGSILSVDVNSNLVIASCGNTTSTLRVSIGIPKGTYIKGIDVTDLQSINGAGAPAPGLTPAPQTPAPSTPPPAPVDVCASQVNGLGNQGPCVTLIQAKLKQLGYNITTVDGIYGTNTRDNVKIFQQKAGLADDGIVGPITWKRLVDTKSCSDPAAKSGCTL